MNNKLQLSPAATITPNAQGVLLQSDLGDFQLHGQDVSEFISHIAPMLDGQHDKQAIFDALPGYDNNSIEAVVNMLMQHGLVEEVEVQDGDTFTPPWQPHERFLQAWSAPEQKPTSSLEHAHLLVIGLEPWAVKMVDELANAGVGHIHVLDNQNLSQDDLLCHRPFTQANLGKPRAEALQQIMAEQAPWCEITYGPLELDNEKQLAVSCQLDWQLVLITLGKEAQFWQHKASDYVQQGRYQALYGNLDGLESCIGPVVKPGETACWNCLRLRKLGTSYNPQMAHALDQTVADNQQAGRARTILSPMAVMTGQQLAMEALKLLLCYTQTNLAGAVQVQNLVTGESEQHTIIPVPWCEVCGHDHSHVAAMQQTSQPTTQVGAMSAVAAHSTPMDNPLNRVSNVEELKDLLKGWIDPLTGVIRQLSGHAPQLPDFPVTASAGVSTFTAGEFDPRGMGGGGGGGGQVGSGKGLDEVSAHISAVGEAIERYSAARYRMEDCKYASVSQLNGDYIDPETLVLYSQKQYNSVNFPFSPFKRKQKIHWAEGHWLGQTKPVWVPALVTYFNFEAPFKEQFSQVSSNGLAAGQNPEDAGIRATYELIERDAMMLTWYARQPCQRLKIDSQYKGKMRVMIDDITSRGISLELYLLDVGIHVPTVVCLAFGNGISTPAVSVALACHGDINVAMRKALLEQGHVMPYLCQLMNSGQRFPQQVHEVQSLEDHAAYYFSTTKTAAFDFMRQPFEQAITPEDWPYPVVSDAADLRQRLVNAGVDVAVVDVTAPDVALSPFSVARAVGVHMQPIHFGEQFKRVDNPRLRKLLKGQPVNNDPHPIA